MIVVREVYTLKDRLKEIRNNENMTMEEFGNCLGVTKTAISRLEKGERNLTNQMIKSICERFGINEEWLRTGEGEMYNLPEDKTAAVVSELLEESNPVYDAVISIVQTYQKLDEKSQKVLDNFIKEVYENFKKEG